MPKVNYTFETISCNLCGSDSEQLVSDKGRFGLPTNVVLCRNCGLGYLNPRWTAESYIKFYQEDYDTYYRPTMSKDMQSWEQQQNPMMLRLESLGVIPNNVQSILDIGSGEGLNLKFLGREFPNAKQYAIEPSQESQLLLKKSGVDVISESVDTDWNVEYTGKFDIIVMRHVLEHFMNPLEAMKKVRNALSPSGILYLAVPNNLNPTRELETNWFRNVHTYYFNKYSLENLMKLSGFKVQSLNEGDEYNRGEVYLVASCSNVEQPTFSQKHFETQSLVFQDKLKSDNSVINKLVSSLKRLKKKVVG